MSVGISSLGNSAMDESINQDGSLMVYGFMTVDINGAKGPNRYGRDVFEFFITKTGIYPRGLFAKNEYWNDPTYGGCRPSSPYGTAGAQCAGRIIDQGWMMGY